MKITKALIIDEPWITKILNGEKDWEMRTSNSKLRGPIGLIRKGSGQVVGTANFTNVSGPYNNDQLAVNISHHHVGAELVNDPNYKWRYAWELSSAKWLDKAVPYIHKNGAVIWVDLNPEAIKAIGIQLSGVLLSPFIEEPIKLQQSKAEQLKTVITSRVESVVVSEGLKLVPIAKDGSKFSLDDCNNKGIYTVGDKGDEKKFRNFHEALDYLKMMPKARWRRPNANGNYGIVAAIDWV